ncbi:hypothetical protein EJ06DRAFT_324708 [Trichodelitschia bisporula]|uniref:Uncharacterized protein n=1 Tax=Trichodelitschia bisporula TaxID=703511 RepID=A0A6G1I4N2_9PEZI|nr:hypothetical protein EJ06DRAFT_324708 [Trichodelitschia bisporula]
MGPDRAKYQPAPKRSLCRATAAGSTTGPGAAGSTGRAGSPGGVGRAGGVCAAGWPDRPDGPGHAGGPGPSPETRVGWHWPQLRDYCQPPSGLRRAPRRFPGSTAIVNVTSHNEEIK